LESLTHSRILERTVTKTWFSKFLTKHYSTNNNNKLLIDNNETIKLYKVEIKFLKITFTFKN